MLDESKVLLSKAEEDKNACEQLNSAVTNKLHAIICFHAQQMAEKSVKALWKKLHSKEEIKRSHDIGHFLEEINAKISVPEKLMDWADNLTELEADTRYMQQEHIDESITENALYQANKLYSWALDRIHEHEQSITKPGPNAVLSQEPDITHNPDHGDDDIQL